MTQKTDQIEYRSPRNTDELNATILCSIHAFNGKDRDFSDDHFFSQIIKNDPYFDLENTRACFVNGEVASVVQIFERPIRIGNCVVKMGGLGSVGTHPDHRRKGYSSEVLKDTVDYLIRADFDFSILFTGINKHYNKAEWETVPTTELKIKPKKIDLPKTDLSIAPCDYQRDLPQLIKIYDEFNRDRTGTTVRTDQYWRGQPKWRGVDPKGYFWVAKDGDQIVAYLRWAKWGCREFACLDRSRSALKPLFAMCINHFVENGKTDVSWEDLTESREIFDEFGLEYEIETGTHTMLRLTNFRSLLRKISPLLSERLRSSDLANWNGSINICYELDNATIKIENGSVQIVDDEIDHSVKLSLTYSDVLSLIFGNFESEIEIVSTLFPPQDLLLWEADSF